MHDIDFAASEVTDEKRPNIKEIYKTEEGFNAKEKANAEKVSNTEEGPNTEETPNEEGPKTEAPASASNIWLITQISTPRKAVKRKYSKTVILTSSPYKEELGG